ncbi:abscission/NoCut checkpoint regulator isoform X2 [Balaenoptera musculus]|uniref:Abscission/NoCut checkpoint regulator n=1 Tax=Balaenoptera musculus TaxID=9771 RepID=A0A8B8WUZ2_BALMU|nr:abscission/NoCut checkpoint regulator isoform X2 [Balaenoptera musculus]
MESRCYGCAVKFTLFKKEYGCKNCGRAFCSGCLSFSAAVPRAGNTQQKVCKQCHEVLTRGSSPAIASKWSPPQNYKKVSALAGGDRSQASCTEGCTPGFHPFHPGDGGTACCTAGQSSTFSDPPAATSIQNDLNQGGPGPQSTSCKGQATWSLEEEKRRLLAEAAVALQEENTRQERILALAKRLAVLQGRDPDRVTLQDYRLPDSDDEEDEETAIQRVLQQLTEEAALDEASGFNIPAEPTLQPQAQSCRAEPEVQAMAAGPEAEEEELPWCCICNEDATLRCASCDGDLYCVRCFREGHDAFELKEHQTSAYHPQHKSREH